MSKKPPVTASVVSAQRPREATPLATIRTVPPETDTEPHLTAAAAETSSTR